MMDDLEIDGETTVHRPSPSRMDRLNKCHEKQMDNIDSVESGYGSGSLSLPSVNSLSNADINNLRDDLCQIGSNSMGALKEQSETTVQTSEDIADIDDLANRTKNLTVECDDGFVEDNVMHATVHLCPTKPVDRITPEALILYGKDADGDNLLFLALINGQVPLATVIIQMAPSSDWLDIYNDELRQTALHLAVLMRQVSVVRRLVVGGACVEMCDHNGDTPLHIACRQGDIETARALLEPVRYDEIRQNEYDIRYQRIPQNLEIRNSSGCTCMHVAAENGHLNIVKLLLSKGAQINNGDSKRGATVLHKAAETGDLTLTTFLLGLNGINVDSRMYNGSTPAAIAYGRRHVDIVDILKKFGAKSDLHSDHKLYESEDSSDSDE